jgi:tight adherence protein B
MDVLPMVFLATLAVGGVAYVFLYPLLSGERQAEKRRESIAKPEKAVRHARQQQRSRRETIESTLKQVDERNKKGKVTLQFILISVGCGFGFTLLGFLVGASLPVVAALAFAGGFGLPRWLLRFLKKRREQKFLDGFADGVDVIVRGVKAGLPLLDCIKMVAAEAAEPIRSEFKALVDTQAIGMPLGEACGKLYERMPLPEANFFGIVVGIQQKAGGNLSEALGNLSRVLRDRKKMKGKVRAMSQEAKASAMIIGALPLVVMTLVYLTSPGYIAPLFTESVGHLMLAACVVWMAIGVLVMRKMINFDF